MIPQIWRYQPPVAYPIHTRATPEINGPRTESILHPGEVFRVSEGREGVDGVLYLKLADGRGWVFESKPGLGTMCVEHKFGPAPAPPPTDLTEHESSEQVPAPTTTTITVTYVCSEGSSALGQNGRTAEEQRWCRMHAAPSPPAPQPREKAVAQPSPTDFDFDCEVDADKWRRAWSRKKAEWCCKKTQVGCAQDLSKGNPDYDCTIWFDGYEKTWPPKQREWCCRNKHEGCPKTRPLRPRVGYDCHKGWRQLWAPRKREYCCDFHHVGCTAGFSEEFAEGKGAVERWPGDVKSAAVPALPALSSHRIMVAVAVAMGLLVSASALLAVRWRRRSTARQAVLRRSGRGDERIGFLLDMCSRSPM